MNPDDIFGKQTIKQAFDNPEGTPIWNGLRMKMLRRLKNGKYRARFENGRIKTFDGRNVLKYKKD